MPNFGVPAERRGSAPLVSGLAKLREDGVLGSEEALRLERVWAGGPT